MLNLIDIQENLTMNRINIVVKTYILYQDISRFLDMNKMLGDILYQNKRISEEVNTNNIPPFSNMYINYTYIRL